MTSIFLASRFPGSNGSAWNTTIGTWQNSQVGTGQSITIQSGQGRLNPGTGSTQSTMQHNAAVGPNCAMKMKFTFQTTGGANGNLEFWLREASGTAANLTGYFIQIPAHSGVNLITGRGGTYPTLATSAFTFTTGTQYWIEFSALGTGTVNLDCRIWAVSSIRPSSSTVTAADSTTPANAAGFSTLHVITSGATGEQVDFSDVQFTDGTFIDFDFPRTPARRKLIVPAVRRILRVPPAPAPKVLVTPSAAASTRAVKASVSLFKKRPAPQKLVATQIVVPPDFRSNLSSGRRLISRPAVRRGHEFPPPKPQTVTPPPYPVKYVAQSLRVGIPRYARRKPGESLRAFAPFQPDYPKPWSTILRRATNFRRIVRRYEPGWPQATAPLPPALVSTTRRSRAVLPASLSRKRTAGVLAQGVGIAPPLVSVTLRRQRLGVLRRRSTFAAAPNAQDFVVAERVTARRMPTVRRRMTANTLPDTPLPRAGRRGPILPMASRRTRPSFTVKTTPPAAPVGAPAPARRRGIPRRGSSAVVVPSSGYINPTLVPRGRVESSFREGMALRRGRVTGRSAWNNPIAPVFIPRWVRTRRMEGIKSRLGRGRIFVPVIQVVDDIVYTISTASKDSWLFGYTADNWQLDDDNDNWVFGFAGG